MPSTSFAARACYIVDDHHANLSILKEMVESHAMEATLATSGAEALQLLAATVSEGNPYRLIISDVNMPEIDGYTLAEKIGENEILLPIPIILLTSSGHLGVSARVTALGITAQLMKPVKPSELFDAMVRALGLAAESDASHPEEVPCVTPEVEPGAHPLPRLRILLAEDSMPNQMLALALLNIDGHETVLAANGREAVEAITTQAFDIVLMDIQMPEMDGYTATSAIRAWEQKAGGHIPIVAVTAHAMKGDRERCLEAGMDEYISKPIRKDKLRAVIAEALRSTGHIHGSDGATGDAVGPNTNLTGGLASQSRQAPDPAVPWKELLDVVGGDRQTLEGIVTAYLAEIQEMADLMPRAIGNQDAVALCKSAHKLKSALRFFQLAEVAELAERLEQKGVRKDLGSAEAEFAELDRHVEKLVPILKAYSAQSP
jgi:CheY-like chemotaxis protein/HPt (histidine-containing phosphotransfer) domain-containing protein